MKRRQPPPSRMTPTLRRLRGGHRAPVEVRRRRLSSVMAMVDLLSCAFGGALFLFMLTATPMSRPEAAPEALSALAVVTVKYESRSVRPIVLVQPPNGGRRFLVDATRLGPSGRNLRAVDDARSNDAGGRVLVYGPTPWDVDPDVLLPPIRLLFEKPALGEWCFRLGVASDDSSSRHRFGSEIRTDAVQIKVQPLGGIEARPESQPVIPEGIGFAEPVCFPLT